MNAVRLIYDSAVILFTSNMIAGLFWKLHADSTRNSSIIRHTLGGIIKSDVFITVPVLAIILSCNYSINSAVEVPLITVSMSTMIFFVATYSIGVFITIIHPLRKRLISLVSVNDIDYDRDTYRRVSQKWTFWGIMELGPLIALLILSL